MLKAFTKHITTNFSYIKGKRLLVAISGGVDSVVVTHLLNTLDYNISLGHCNFCLRDKESDADEEFVENLGKQLSRPVFTERFDTTAYSKKNKVSIQIAARELRYQWFAKIIAENNIDYIVTAHHADDNLETFLINFSRGTGLDGLMGIPEKNNDIIRPLLPFSREDIVNYANEQQITWREDKSNAEKKYLRNKIRHTVIPILKEINPNLLQGFSRTVAHLEESRAIVNEKVSEISPKILSKSREMLKISIAEMLKLTNPKAYLYEILKVYNFTEWDNVFDLLKAQSGKIIYSNTHVLLKDREYLLLKELNKINLDKRKILIPKGVNQIKEPINLYIEFTEKKQSESKNYVLVNKNLVTFPMILRKWEEGDFFYPMGMSGKKKVSKFFKDEKLSKFEKNDTWLLCNADNKIIWIVGMRQDRRFAITSETNKFFKISL